MNNDMLEIQKFIKNNPNWEKLLVDKPYCLNITKDHVNGRNLVMFKYNQIDSDLSIKLVQQCRGLILDLDTFEIVSYAFDKFFNYEEPYAADIDWKSCYVTEKLDGSLVKLSRIGDNILWSTNGTIDAYKAPLVEQIGCIAKSFGELAWYAILENYCKARDLSVSGCIDPDIVKDWLKSIIKPGYTYMFELTSPYNKVVVTWHKTELHFIGCRDNESGQEIFFGDHELSKIFDIPKIFPLRSVDECIKAASELDVNAEGYVVVDKDFNRVKIKSPLYVSIHHLRGENGVMSYKRALEIVKTNEVAEVLTYFPEYKSAFDELEKRFTEKVAQVEAAWKEFASIKDTLLTRKDQAIWIMSHVKEFSGFMFGMLDGKITDIHDAIFNAPNDKIIRMLGFKE